MSRPLINALQPGVKLLYVLYFRTLEKQLKALLVSKSSSTHSRILRHTKQVSPAQLLCCDGNCRLEQITVMKALKSGAPGDTRWAETVSFFSLLCGAWMLKDAARESCPKFRSALRGLCVTSGRLNPCTDSFPHGSIFLYRGALWFSHQRRHLWPNLPLMSIPAVSAVDPEIKPSDVAALPTAQPPICHQSVDTGGNVLVPWQKQTFWGLVITSYKSVVCVSENKLCLYTYATLMHLLHRKLYDWRLSSHRHLIVAPFSYIWLFLEAHFHCALRCHGRRPSHCVFCFPVWNDLCPNATSF